MRVLLKTILARPDANGSPGEKITVSDELGDQLVAGGYADIVDVTAPKPEPVPEIESAAVEQDERAVQPPPKRRRSSNK